ncbi:MAG: AAA family ATPase [Candidatus Moranbacteria bacterium]|nr:AAA family ATPase [Candidatus Moranbacteria bacterium]
MNKIKEPEKIVIGVTGKNGSGKDTVCDFIEKKYQAKKLVFSDLLKKALSVFLDHITRNDFSWLSTNLRQRYGEGILAKGMKIQIEKTREKIIVVSGVRDFGELKMIKSYKNGYLVYVDVNLKIRWERISRRGTKIDDKISFKEFKAIKEKLPSEKDIQALGNSADFIIKNNSGLKDLEMEIEKIMNKIL